MAKLALGCLTVRPEVSQPSLRVNNALANLYLSDNLIGATGAAAIAEALGVNSSLAGLVIRDNPLGEAAKKALRAATKCRAGFKLYS